MVRTPSISNYDLDIPGVLRLALAYARATLRMTLLIVCCFTAHPTHSTVSSDTAARPDWWPVSERVRMRYEPRRRVANGAASPRARRERDSSHPACRRRRV